MIFVDWSFWRTFFLASVTLSAVIGVLFQCKKWSLPLRVSAWLFGVPVASIAIFFFLFVFFGVLWGYHSHGRPAYSPDHRTAARVETWDAGGTGGGTNVRIYRDRGFSSKLVFIGGWKSVKDENLQWLDDTHLSVTFNHYDGYNELSSCSDAGAIHVICVPDAPTAGR